MERAGVNNSNAYSERKIRELTCLYEVARELSASDNLRKALSRITEILEERMGFLRGTVSIVGHDNVDIKIEVAHGISSQARKRGRYKIGEGITGQVVATGEPIIIPDISSDSRFLNRTRSRGDIKDKNISFICVPIKLGQRTIGAFSVDRLAGQDVTLEDDLKFTMIISSLIAHTVGRLQAARAERESLVNENRTLRLALTEKYEIGNFVSRSGRMAEVFDMVARVSESNATVLLRGESGTGKSMIAKTIHFNSPRKKGPFVVVNCSALPETLIESELFGHEKGAFTGASGMKKGRFELADGGTIFLDEIGELPQSVQVKLLTVIQEKEFQRLGGTRTIKSNVRIIAATNRNLEEAMKAGEFREDLYYRLNVFPIYLPPLRERRTDLIMLAEHFLARYARENHKNIKRISEPAIDCLMKYRWPGNIRELQNCIERAVLVSDEDVIRIHHLPPHLQNIGSGEDGRRNIRSLSGAVANFEKEMIIEALADTGGNQTRAAKLLDTSLRIINYKINKYNIDVSQFKKKRLKKS
jgi:Nif-specific regulatory protein